jgi:ABC-2 type transport system permease protein
MSFFPAVYKKDLRSIFGSPAAYVFLTSFVLLAGFFFYRGMLFLSAVSLQAARNTVINVNQIVFQPLYSNYVFILVLLIPLLTMRLFSEERKSGTLELLCSYPARPLALAAAKYACGLTVFSAGLLLTLVFPLLTSFFGYVEWAPILTSYAGLFLAGSALTALGALFSSLTDNQIIAASAGLGASALFWVVGWVSRYLPPPLGRLAGNLSLHERMGDFIRGVINTDAMFFFVNVTVTALVLTVMSLRSQRFGG